MRFENLGIIERIPLKNSEGTTIYHHIKLSYWWLLRALRFLTNYHFYIQFIVFMYLVKQIIKIQKPPNNNITI